MARLVFANQSLVDAQELQRLERFLVDDGYRFLLLQLTAKFGLLYNERINGQQVPADFTNFKVESGTNSGTVKVLAGQAINNQGRFIRWTGQDNITIPADNQWYYVRAEYQEQSFEQGQVSLAANGTLTGTGTAFLSTLRSQPNFASRLRLYTRNILTTTVGAVTTINPQNYQPSLTNPGAYEVADVLTDTELVLAGGSFVAQNDLYYARIGTFTDGYTPAAADEQTFRYDGCLLILTTDVAAVADQQFIVARVRNNGAVVEIQDLRTQFFQLRDGLSLTSITGSPDIVGVESVQFDVLRSTKSRGVVKMGWGFRVEALQFTVESSSRTLVINAGRGGRYESTADFPADGTFDGYRVYSLPDNSEAPNVNEGRYARVIESIKIGSSIRLRLDSLDPSIFNPARPISIVPDAEAIVFRFVRSIDSTRDDKFTEEQEFPIFWAQANIKLPVWLAPSTIYRYFFFLRSNKDYSQHYFPVVTGLPSHPTRYLAESSFDEQGVQLTPAVYKLASTTNPLELADDPDSYANFQAAVDIGDRNGVETLVLTQSVLDAASEVIKTLRTRQNTTYQAFRDDGQVGLTLTKTVIINIETQPDSIAGNFFWLDFVIDANINYQTFDIEVRADYTDVNPGVLLFSFREYRQRREAGFIAGTPSNAPGIPASQIRVKMFARYFGLVGSPIPAPRWVLRWFEEPTFNLEQIEKISLGFATENKVDKILTIGGITPVDLDTVVVTGFYRIETAAGNLNLPPGVTPLQGLLIVNGNTDFVHQIFIQIQNAGQGLFHRSIEALGPPTVWYPWSQIGDAALVLATIAGAGLNPDGSYTADVATNYLKPADFTSASLTPSLNAADKLLDAQIKITNDNLIDVDLDTNKPGMGKPWFGPESTIPPGYVVCNGQTLNRVAFAALFAALGNGTIWGGGDGFSTFNVPDMRGRVPVGVDPGLSRSAGTNFDFPGNVGGSNFVTLTTNQIPNHSHKMFVGRRPEGGNETTLFPNNSVTSQRGSNGTSDYSIAAADDNANPTAGRTENVGGGQSHENRMPYGTVYWIIKTT